MTAGAIFVVSVFAFAALALSMRRHHRDVFGASLSRGRAQFLRAAGWLLLAVSFLCAVADKAEVGNGVALWFGMATMSAMIVAMGLTCCFTVSSRGAKRRDPPTIH